MVNTSISLMYVLSPIKCAKALAQTIMEYIIMK